MSMQSCEFEFEAGVMRVCVTHAAHPELFQLCEVRDVGETLDAVRGQVQRGQIDLHREGGGGVSTDGEGRVNVWHGGGREAAAMVGDGGLREA